MPDPSTIGTETFLTLKGQLQPMAEETVDISRPGVDGRAFLKTGTRGERFRMLGIRPVLSAAAMVTRAAAYKALQSTLQTVTDDMGTFADNVMIHHVRVLRTQRITTPVSAGGVWDGTQYLVYSEWEMEPTE